ncbi:hypothetical protein Ddye_000019 [Dipteronia dyeriana]|uniref:F-box associated beta-propeller type 1 domain-containing protein n=1 Tax=Dipteronia dyeriana TaxID=168575 RepID=A0AAD9XLI7_9ROSI|nr:hypothetical protein Ddye_000019 [Dipteronia dyeriana]
MMKNLAYFLRNNSWKIVDGNFLGRKPNIIDGVSLNGTVHRGTFCLPDSVGVITVFDLAEERFKTLPFLDIPNPTTRLQGIVNVVGEYLCVHFGDYNSYSDQTPEFWKAAEGIWMMKEYGVQESWIRFVISDHLFDPDYLFVLYHYVYVRTMRLFFVGITKRYFAVKKMEKLERCLCLTKDIQDMNTNSDEENGDKPKVNDGVDKYGGATGLHTIKLHHSTLARQLEQQPWRQQHK